MSNQNSPEADLGKLRGLKKAAFTTAKVGGFLLGKTALLLTAAALSTNPEPGGVQSPEPTPVVAPQDETIRGELELVSLPTPIALPRVGVAAMAAFSAPASLDRPAASATPLPALSESGSASYINISMSEDEIKRRGIDPYSAEHIFAMCLKPDFLAVAYSPDQQPLHRGPGLAMVAPAVEAKPAELSKEQIFECFNKEPVITKWIADTMGINLKDPKTQENAKAFESVYENLPKALVENGIMTLEQAQSVFGKQVTMTFKLTEKDKDGKVTQSVRAGEAKILDTQGEVDERRARNEKMVFWKGETYNILVIGNRVLIFRQDCANLLIWQIPQPRVVAPPTVTPAPAQPTPSETPRPVLVPVTPSATPTQWTTTNQPTPTETPRPVVVPPTETPRPATATRVPATPTVRSELTPQTVVPRTPSGTPGPTNTPETDLPEDRTPIVPPARPSTIAQTVVAQTPSAVAASVAVGSPQPVGTESRRNPNAAPTGAAAPVQAGAVSVVVPGKPGVAGEVRNGTQPGKEAPKAPVVTSSGSVKVSGPAPKAAPVPAPKPAPRAGTSPSGR